MTVKRRLLANFGAGTVCRAINIGIQIASVPVMLSHWGARVYGAWILLSTIPSYFAMSDIGFGNVAGNEMTMLVAGGKREEALDVFQSVGLFITAVSIFMAGLLGLGIWLLPLEKWLKNGVIGAHDARLIVEILCISSLLTLQEGLFQSSFRCVGKYALGTAAKSAVGLSAFAAVMVAVFFGASPLRVAVLTVAMNTLGTFALWWLLRHQIDWIRYGVQHARVATVRRLFWPAVSFMSFPISNILSLQGILMVIGHVFGPVGVVAFSTARTISRSVLQALAVINASFWPEISAAFGTGSIALVRKLHRASCQLSIFLCVGVTMVAAIFGNSVWKTWTLGKFQTDPVLLYILLLQMLIGAFWYSSSVVPAATNRHQGTASYRSSTFYH